MFMAGIKFGNGYWLGTMVLVALVASLIGLASHARRCFERRKSYPKSSRTKAGYLLWTKGPESIHHDDDRSRHISLRTTVRWGGRRVEPRKEPHYRY